MKIDDSVLFSIFMVFDHILLGHVRIDKKITEREKERGEKGNISAGTTHRYFKLHYSIQLCYDLLADVYYLSLCRNVSIFL